ncbi:MAG: aldehyde ferredoxin oxidoreductase [Candidatus Bathyarchaeota archaeon]|nr:aldehyde ferredoxin oxidoreductase [Candidatus Bathyarchaeota archaeon]
MEKIIRIDMTDLKTKVEKVPKKYKEKGGRWLTSSLIKDEVDPTCHPLGPNNKLIFAPGIVTGANAPSSGRLSVGGKSPLTGGIKEANAGTPFSQILAKLDVKAIILEGKPKDNKFWVIKFDKDGVNFESANNYLGKGLYEAYPLVFDKYGKKVGIAGIGVAGEMLMTNAGVCFNDIDNRPSRYAGRGGLGAVMGSKGVKFIVLDDKGTQPIKPQNRDMFNEGRKKLTAAITTNAITKKGGMLNSLGTAALVNVVNEAGGLPTRNFSEGRFEGAATTSGEAIAEAVKARGGKGMTGHACHPGCIIQCSNVYPKLDGSEHVSCIEYESTWAFGANCGIDNLDDIAEMIWQCNDYGLDTIEGGGAMAVAMEGGLANFGDGKKAIELMKEIKKGSVLGKALGCGAATIGKVLGVTRIPGAKGQNMPAYEPRAIKGIGITYATSPMGADHTAGYTIAPEIAGVTGKLDPLDPDKAAVSKAFQDLTAFVDATGYCLFVTFATAEDSEAFQGLIDTCNAILGTNWTNDDVLAIGRKIIDVERAFNAAAGFTQNDDRLPEFMKYEKLPPHNHVFDVPDDALDKVHG